MWQFMVSCFLMAFTKLGMRQEQGVQQRCWCFCFLPFPCPEFDAYLSLKSSAASRALSICRTTPAFSMVCLTICKEHIGKIAAVLFREKQQPNITTIPSSSSWTLYTKVIEWSDTDISFETIFRKEDWEEKEEESQKATGRMQQ